MKDNNFITRRDFLATSGLTASALMLEGAAQSGRFDPELRLWYRQPASDWNEALPVGNGRLGAMIFGGVARERLQLNDACLCARLENDRHFAELETYVSSFLQEHPASDIVLTGKATSIQHINRLLRQRNIGSGRRQSKAYWAPGKAGLD